MHHHMCKQINAYTEGTHAADDGKAHDVLWSIVGREQVSAIDLSKVAKGIDQRERDSSYLLRHRAECRSCVRKSQTVRSPKSSGHEDQQNVSCCEVVDCTNTDA